MGLFTLLVWFYRFGSHVRSPSILDWSTRRTKVLRAQLMQSQMEIKINRGDNANLKKYLLPKSQTSYHALSVCCFTLRRLPGQMQCAATMLSRPSHMLPCREADIGIMTAKVSIPFFSLANLSSLLHISISQTTLVYAILSSREDINRWTLVSAR